MFEATHGFLPFDYHRVPYALRATGRASDGDDPISRSLPGFARLWRSSGEAGSPVLHWALSRPGTPRHPSARGGAFKWNGSHIFGRVVPDQVIRPTLPADRTWRRLQTLATDTDIIASIWTSDAGDYVLPFDPDEVIQNFWSEAYLDRSQPRIKSRAIGLARQIYYRTRPLMPRAVQIRLRRGYSRMQSRPSFPEWPVETSLHDTIDALLELAATVAGEPIPSIATWPSGHTWAAVLTHDVEHAAGRDSIEPVLALEQRRGLRSSWNFVPERYQTNEQTLSGLRAAGCEIGVHGLKHDGRDFESFKTFTRRLPEIRRHAELWGAVGFRSPSTHRVWKWMEMLGFDYDTSSPDTDPFEPQAGGCCSWLPFFNGNMVELPITLPQDHTLFVILGDTSADQWLAKAAAIRERGGMALVIVHPDYMADPGRLEAYADYLDMLAADAGVWAALPRDVATWWRSRADSSAGAGRRRRVGVPRTG